MSPVALEKLPLNFHSALKLPQQKFKNASMNKANKEKKSEKLGDVF